MGSRSQRRKKEQKKQAKAARRKMLEGSVSELRAKVYENLPPEVKQKLYNRVEEAVLEKKSLEAGKLVKEGIHPMLVYLGWDKVLTIFLDFMDVNKDVFGDNP